MKELPPVSDAYSLGVHHGMNGAAPRTGIAVDTAKQFMGDEERRDYLSGVRTGWESRGRNTPTR